MNTKVWYVDCLRGRRKRSGLTQGRKPLRRILTFGPHDLPPALLSSRDAGTTVLFSLPLELCEMLYDLVTLSPHFCMPALPPQYTFWAHWADHQVFYKTSTQRANTKSCTKVLERCSAHFRVDLCMNISNPDGTITSYQSNIDFALREPLLAQLHAGRDRFQQHVGNYPAPVYDLHLPHIKMLNAWCRFCPRPRMTRWRAVQETGIHEVVETDTAAAFMLDNSCSSTLNSIGPVESTVPSVHLLDRLEASAQSALGSETMVSLALMVTTFFGP